MAKNIVICLDGTNNQLKSAVNTNVVRLFAALDLSNPEVQVGYYDPGVGTFSSRAAWTPLARTVSRYAGLMFGAGLTLLAIVCSVVPTAEIRNVLLFELKLAGGTLAMIVSAWLLYGRFKSPAGLPSPSTS